MKELLFVGLDDIGRVFGDVDGGFVYLRFCFGGGGGLVGDGGEVDVDELDAAFEAGDAMGDGAGGVEFFDGTGNGFEFGEFGGDSGGDVGAAGNGEIPLGGETCQRAVAISLTMDWATWLAGR